MKPIKNWDSVQAVEDWKKLPNGGYACRIFGAKERTVSNGSTMLEVSIDISEGEFKDYYATDYRNQTNENKKWRGVLRLFVPTDDGSEKDNLTKKIFKGFTNAVEDSNPGYHWDWNENGLKGKAVGMITRNEEWEWEGKTGMSVRPFKAVSVDDIRSGNYTLPKDKYLNGSAPATSAPSNDGFAAIEGGDDLPF